MKPYILNGVFGLAINDKKQVLLSQRHQPQHPDVHMKWQIPGGGQEYGEHLEVTLRRELAEELLITDFEILNSTPYFAFSCWERQGETKVHVNLFTYVIRIHNQTPKIADEETADWKWLDLSDVENLDTLPNVKETISKVAEQFL